MSVTVEGRALAKRKFQTLDSGRPHELRLTDGAAVTGRLVREGKPVGGASVGLVSVARVIEEFTGEYEIATTKDGRFLLPNVPPEIDYFLYSRMTDAKSSGGVARVKNQVFANFHWTRNKLLSPHEIARAERSAIRQLQEPPFRFA